MAWIQHVPRSRAEGRLLEVYRQYLPPDTEAPAILAVGGLHPEGLGGHLGLYQPLMFGQSPLSREQREMIATVVSSVNDCHY